MFNLPPGLFNLRILVNKQPLLTRWETTWGWASTDNANSPGFSARKFIIFSGLAAPNSSAQKTQQNTLVLDPSPGPPRSEDASSARQTCLFPFSASLARCSPKGFLLCVINFTFSVCRRVERRLCPSSRPARPRGHQLKALIGQQYIKVAPRSGSSERQESVSWALFQIEKYRREKLKN